MPQNLEGHPGQPAYTYVCFRILSTSFTSVSIFSVWCYSSVSISKITYKVAVCALDERADTLHLFHLYRCMYYVVSAISAGAYTATLCVIVDIVKGGGRAVHPPPLPSLGCFYPSTPEKSGSLKFLKLLSTVQEWSRRGPVDVKRVLLTI